MNKPLKLIFIFGLIACLVMLSWPEKEISNDPNLRTSDALDKESEGEADKVSTSATEIPTDPDSTSSDITSETPELVDERPELKGDRWVTGLVKNENGLPVEGAVVYFHKMPQDNGLDLGPMARLMDGMKKQYKSNEVEDEKGDLFGNSMAIVTGKDGRFKVRWPRVDTTQKKLIDEAMTHAMEGTIDEMKDMDFKSMLPEEVDWAASDLHQGPRMLRAAHDLYLPDNLDVQPGDDVEMVLASSGGIDLKVVDVKGKPVGSVRLSSKPEGFDFSSMIHERTDDEGQLRLLLKPGEYSFKLTHEENAPVSFTITVTDELISKTVAMGDPLFYTGRMVDQEGLPIVGVELSTSPDVEKIQAGNFEMAMDFHHVSAETSDDGVFKLGPFTELGIGETVINAKHNMYEKMTLETPTGFELGDIKMTPLPGLVVRVVDSEGNPVVGAGVWTKITLTMEEMNDPEKAAEWGESLGMGLVGFHDKKLTDEQGEVIVHGQGNHELHVSHKDFAPQAEFPKINFDSIANGQEEKIVLKQGASILLTIRNWENAPVADATVRAIPEEKAANMIEMMAKGVAKGLMPDFRRSSDLKTDDKGQVRLTHVAETLYKVEISAEELPKTFHRMDVTESMKTFDIKLDPPAILYGTVDREFAGRELMIQSLNKTHMVRVKDNGKWESPPLAPGGYRVKFVQTDNMMSMGMEMFGGMAASDDMVKLKAGQRLKVDVTPPATGELTVTVNDPKGDPWNGMIMLVLAGFKQGDMDFAGKMHIGKKKSNGVYHFKGIPEGDWRLQAGVGMGGTSADRLAVHLRDGEKRSLTWNLREANGSVSGRLLDSAGKGRKGLAQLYREDDELPVANAQVGSDGKFNFTKLVSGTYELRLGDGMSNGRKVATLEVSGPDTDAGDIVVADGIKLTGKVVVLEGDLPFGISVRLMRNGANIGIGMPDLDGAFAFGNLEGAPAVLEVVDSSGKTLGTADWDGESTTIEVQVEGDKW